MKFGWFYDLMRFDKSEKKSRLLRHSSDGELKLQCGHVLNTYIIRKQISNGTLILDARKASFTTKLSSLCIPNHRQPSGHIRSSGTPLPLYSLYAAR